MQVCNKAPRGWGYGSEWGGVDRDVVKAVKRGVERGMERGC